MQPQDLCGAWALTGWTITRADGSVAHPFGPDATGLLCYTPGGTMSACIARAVRADWSTGTPRSAPQAERLAAFDSYFHYAGRWRVELREGLPQVIHDVTHSLNPGFVGSQQVRQVDLHGDVLVLSAIEGARHHVLGWRRYDV